MVSLVSLVNRPFMYMVCRYSKKILHSSIESIYRNGRIGVTSQRNIFGSCWGDKVKKNVFQTHKL